MSTEMQMPKYKIEEDVSALQIDYVDGADLVFKDKRFAPLYVGPAWIDKHHPQPDGYLVVSKDGYRFFSPAKTFEQSYTLIK